MIYFFNIIQDFHKIEIYQTQYMYIHWWQDIMYFWAHMILIPNLKIEYQQKSKQITTTKETKTKKTRDFLQHDRGWFFCCCGISWKNRPGLHMMSQTQERKCKPNTPPPLSSLKRSSRKIRFNTSYPHPPAAIKIKKCFNILNHFDLGFSDDFF